MKKDNIVICFCKHPEPGKVKSRLAADLGKDHAAKIYEILLNQTLLNITQDHQHGNYKVILYCYPDINHSSFCELKNKYSLSLKQQSKGNLGDKMYHAINKQLSGNKNIILVGSDCLEIDSSYIAMAFNELDSGNKITLGPTIDGGYALIGANQIHKSIFEDINWSTSDVLEQTISKIEKLYWEYSCLPKVRDIDRIEDYQYFSTHHKYKALFN